jgi:hypothetical protein
MTEETTTAKRGRKPDPILRYRKAKEAAEKLRQQMATKDSLAERLEAAEAAEEEAYKALNEELNELGLFEDVEA